MLGESLHGDGRRRRGEELVLLKLSERLGTDGAEGEKMLMDQGGKLVRWKLAGPTCLPQLSNDMHTHYAVLPEKSPQAEMVRHEENS